ncbi:MAG: hypothetical protein K6L74_16850 [Neptuniibacter sp.]
MSDSIWKRLGQQLIDKGLPLLGGAVLGPAGASLGGLIASSIGSDSAEPEILLDQIQQAQPEMIVELKQLEYRHRETLENIALQETQAFLQDRQSAREREVAVVTATGKKDINLYALAWLVVVGYVVLTCVISFIDIPESNSQAAFMLYGGLVSGFSMVLGYFFGSSKGSSDKNLMMERLQAQLQAAKEQLFPKKGEDSPRV